MPSNLASQMAWNLGLLRHDLGYGEGCVVVRMFAWVWRREPIGCPVDWALIERPI